MEDEDSKSYCTLPFLYVSHTLLIHSHTGCCKASFRVYPYAQKGQTNDEAPYIGKILKKPKSMATEIFTDAVRFNCRSCWILCLPL